MSVCCVLWGGGGGLQIVYWTFNTIHHQCRHTMYSVHFDALKAGWHQCMFTLIIIVISVEESRIVTKYDYLCAGVDVFMHGGPMLDHT